VQQPANNPAVPRDGLAPHLYLDRTEVCPGVLVSTVRADVDYCEGDGFPQLFETMVLVDLDAPVETYRREAARAATEERYFSATEAQAVALHERLVHDLMPGCGESATTSSSRGEPPSPPNFTVAGN
jgi:hypothetical protein